MPYLAKITLYPIKSLDGISVPAATVLPSGALQYDRQFAILDDEGRAITAKRFAKIHQLRSRIDPVARRLTLRLGSVSQTFHLDSDRAEFELWLSNFFEIPVTLAEDAERGFPDDTDASGPTVIGTSTLEAVAAWFPGLTAEETALRFRANLEIADWEPFGEDRLFSSPGRTVPFTIGDVRFQGTNPCRRCAVPTRAAATGEPRENFIAEFSRGREHMLPDWTDRAHFDHFYRLAVNTRAAGPEPRAIYVGDPLELA